jgi:hypothetical protein
VKVRAAPDILSETPSCTELAQVMVGVQIAPSQPVRAFHATEHRMHDHQLRAPAKALDGLQQPRPVLSELTGGVPPAPCRTDSPVITLRGQRIGLRSARNFAIP